MVRVNCDYIPAWPIVYYKNGISKTILHILWPLITWAEQTSGNKVFALFYFIFRLAWKESTSTQYVDFFWPIIHLEFNDDGFRFGIRPLFWIISMKGQFRLSILGVVNIFVKDSGDDVWFVLFPFIWYRYKNGKVFFTLAPVLWITSDGDDRLRVILLPVGVFSRFSRGWWLNIAFIFHLAMRSGGKGYFHLLPFIVVKKARNLNVNVCGLIHYNLKHNGKYFFMFTPIFMMFGSDSFFSLYIIPLLVYRKTSSSSLLIIMFIFYRLKNSSRLISMLVPLYYYREWDSKQSRFLNVFLLYNFRRVHSQNLVQIIFFPILWIKMVKGSSFSFHLWPAFGYKISQKSRGYNIYILYPAIIYKNKQGGAFKRFMFLYPICGHYYNDKAEKIKIVTFLPVFHYKRTPESVYGYCVLYFWYTDHSSRGNIRMEIIRRIDPETGEEYDPDLRDVPVPPPKKDTDVEYSIRGFLPLFYFLTKKSERLIVFFPLFLYRWDSKMTKTNLVISLLYYQKRIEDQLLVRWFIPLFYMKRTEDKTHVISPLYFYYKNGSRKFRLIAPVFVDFVKGETHFIYCFPTFIHYRKSIFKFTSFFPLYFRTQDATKNELFTYYFPLWGSGSRGSSENSYYFLFPLFGYKYDRQKHSKRLDILFPLFHFDRDEDSYSLRILPIFWRSYNERNEFLLVMPLYWKFITDKDTRAQINTLLIPFYYKRDSAQYLFTFASPALLPPYYIHYHREASQVENTFVFPFFAHKIKGLDHLRWFLLYVYRHTWRDFSDEMYMNILLYFKLNNPKYRMSGFIPLYVQWFAKETQKYHLRTLFLLAYDRVKTNLRNQTRICLFYLFTNRVTLFLWKNTEKSSTGGALSVIAAEEETIGVDTPPPPKPSFDVHSKKIFFFPLFHYSTSKTDEYYQLSFFWFVKPWIAFIYRFKSDTESTLQILFAYFYRWSSTLTQIAVIWFFNPNIGLFLYEKSPFAVITRLFPLFWRMSTPKKFESVEEMKEESGSNNEVSILSVLYLIPSYGMYNYNYNSAKDKVSHYIFPLYYHKSKGDRQTATSVFYIGHPLVSMFHHTKKDSKFLLRIFPLFYFYRISDSSLPAHGLSILWIGHPDVAFFRTSKSTRCSILSVFPLFWSKTSISDKTYQLSILYVVRKFGLVDYYAGTESDTFRFYFMPLFHISHSEGNTNVSLFYFGHPKGALFTGSFTETYSKFFVFLFFYYMRDVNEQKTKFSLIWIADPRASFIGYWSHGRQSHFHILFVIWFATAEEYVQWGLFWIGWAKSEVYPSSFLNQEASGSDPIIRNIYYPVSLFLSYNDGAYATHHLMPFYRYTNKVVKEEEKLWAMFGLFYLITRKGYTEFRWWYRWIRVKSSPSVYLVEVNPFVAYKRKGNNSRLLFLGGMCGYDDRPSGNTCRICCIEI